MNVHEDSDDHRLKFNRHDDMHYLGDFPKHNETDNILDYSKLAKMKGKDFLKEDYEVRHHKLLKQVRLLKASVK